MGISSVVNLPLRVFKSIVTSLFAQSVTRRMDGRDPDEFDRFSDDLESQPYAVLVREAYKTYKGLGSADVPVLHNLNMSVATGTIYGLLGPSGSGKTTLLSCIVAQNQLTSGDIQIFGKQPERTLISSRVGFMPQETALFNEFSVEETLQLFGKMFGLSKDFTRRRIDFLLSMLHLPNDGRPVKKLSGGQQRRASLAVALLHQPQLLILDEPTVGLDPVVRQCVWDHLVHLAATKRTTIIITTHYIEEARQADTVGMLREGSLLFEGPPSDLLGMANTSSLEEAFLHLCHEKSSYSPDVISSAALNPSKGASLRSKSQYFEGLPSSRRLAALVYKDLLMVSRNWLMILMLVVVPAAVMMPMQYYTAGRLPAHFPIAVFDEDSLANNGSLQRCSDFDLKTAGCFLGKADSILTMARASPVRSLSCDVLSHLADQGLVTVMTDSLEEAIEHVRKTDVYVAIHFEKGFTETQLKRMRSGLGLGFRAPGEVLSLTKMHLYQDRTVVALMQHLAVFFQDAFQSFVKDSLRKCNFPSELIDPPIASEIDVFKTVSQINHYMSPGFMLMIVHALPVLLGFLCLIQEKRDGQIRRVMVAGATSAEIVLGVFLAHASFVAAMAVLTTLSAVFLLQEPFGGSIPLCFAITLLHGFNGVAFGLVLSSLCSHEMQAWFATVVMIIVECTFCPTYWPNDGMIKFFQAVSQAMPHTEACNALRNVQLRSMGLLHPQVLEPLFRLNLWTVIFLVVATWRIKHFS